MPTSVISFCSHDEVVLPVIGREFYGLAAILGRATDEVELKPCGALAGVLMVVLTVLSVAILAKPIPGRL